MISPQQCDLVSNLFNITYVNGANYQTLPPNHREEKFSKFLLKINKKNDYYCIFENLSSTTCDQFWPFSTIFWPFLTIFDQFWPIFKQSKKCVILDFNPKIVRLSPQVGTQPTFEVANLRNTLIYYGGEDICADAANATECLAKCTPNNNGTFDL